MAQGLCGPGLAGAVRGAEAGTSEPAAIAQACAHSGTAVGLYPHAPACPERALPAQSMPDCQCDLLLLGVSWLSNVFGAKSRSA